MGEIIKNGISYSGGGSSSGPIYVDGETAKLDMPLEVANTEYGYVTEIQGGVVSVKSTDPDLAYSSSMGLGYVSADQFLGREGSYVELLQDIDSGGGYYREEKITLGFHGNVPDHQRGGLFFEDSAYPDPAIGGATTYAMLVDQNGVSSDSFFTNPDFEMSDIVHKQYNVAEGEFISSYQATEDSDPVEHVLTLPDESGTLATREYVDSKIAPVVAGSGANSVQSKGSSSQASGDFAVSLGKDNIADQTSGIAIGQQNKVSAGTQSINPMPGPAPVAIGIECYAEHAGAVAIGECTQASGQGSVAIGAGALATGVEGVALGYSPKLYASGVGLTSPFKYRDPDDGSYAYPELTSPITGQADMSTSNKGGTQCIELVLDNPISSEDADKLAIESSGRSRFTTYLLYEYRASADAPRYMYPVPVMGYEASTRRLKVVYDTMNGYKIWSQYAVGSPNHFTFTHFFGSMHISQGPQSTVIGAYCGAYQAYSLAIGTDCQATATQTFAGGTRSRAMGPESTALGNYCTATGPQSFAAGYHSESSVPKSMVLAVQGEATMPGQLVTGRLNLVRARYIDDVTTPVEDYDLFVVGNGSYSTSGPSQDNRHNAFRVRIDGAVFGGNYSATGADYAELFEWSDGNPDSEDRIGLFVTLDEDKIRVAEAHDDVIGIITGNHSVIGNNYDDDWQGKYETDVYGRYIYDTYEEHHDYVESIDPETGEEVRKSSVIKYEAKKISSDYDPSQEYVPRCKRPEWGVVGLLGQLVVNDDGTCQPGKRCVVSTSQPGHATASSDGSGYRVMKRLDDSHILILASFL